MSPATVARSALSVLAVLVASACGGPSGPPGTQADAAQQARASADARLRGTWRLAEYRPEVTLEPMLAGLLAVQIQTMTVHFEAGHMLVQSPTLRFDLPYRIVDAGGPLFKLVANKDGADYTSSCQFSDNADLVSFRAETEPWRGTGKIVRVGP